MEKKAKRIKYEKFELINLRYIGLLFCVFLLAVKTLLNLIESSFY